MNSNKAVLRETAISQPSPKMPRLTREIPLTSRADGKEHNVKAREVVLQGRQTRHVGLLTGQQTTHKADAVQVAESGGEPKTSSQTIELFRDVVCCSSFGTVCNERSPATVLIAIVQCVFHTRRQGYLRDARDGDSYDLNQRISLATANSVLLDTPMRFSDPTGAKKITIKPHACEHVALHILKSLSRTELLRQLVLMHNHPARCQSFICEL